MGTTGQSITLANSIIGVGILAMPFCFQQCGVLLATLILLLMGLVSRLCCYFLLKSALIARRRTFEFLAFHVFGPAGKLAVEVGIIGFLMGTCIAYFVVVGDLGPQIVSKMFNINQSDILRTSIMVIVSLVCVLPLGLLRNVDSLSNVSAATIGFYFCLVIKVIAEAVSQMVAGDWQARVELWRPAGVLQCVPIFSMALFCQTQLFEIFESQSMSLEKMNVVTKNAINICACMYFTLGLFGYIAFCTQTISGNILMSLSPTWGSDVIKLGFVMSLAFSFPLIIFPCRASLYSFLYRKVHTSHHDHIINHSIPETTFRCITVVIIAAALCVSLLLPNIELVLGLVGSTIGVLVCVAFPAACFVSVTFKDTNERLLAKVILVLGLFIMVLGTYANLQAAEQQTDKYDERVVTQERIDRMVEEFFQAKKLEKSDVLIDPAQLRLQPQDTAQNGKNDEKESEVQPPNPVPPESLSNEKLLKPAESKEVDKENQKLLKPIPDVIAPNKVVEAHPRDLKTKLSNEANGAAIIEKSNEAKEVAKPSEKTQSIQEKIDIKQKQLIETIKQHGEEQKELIKEQKEILDEIKKTKQEIHQEKEKKDSDDAKKIAVESIQKIANMAIQSLGGVSDKPADNAAEIKPLEEIANEAVQEIAKKAVETIEAIKDIKEKPKDDQKTKKESVPNTSKTGIKQPAPNVNNNQENINSAQPVHINNVQYQEALKEPVASKKVIEVKPQEYIKPVPIQKESKDQLPVKQDITNAIKPHQHSPDEPQSYKEGEDLQTVPKNEKRIINGVNQNLPIPIALNANTYVNHDLPNTGPKNADIPKTIIENKDSQNIIKDTAAIRDDKILDNNVKNDDVQNVINRQAAPMRQKREVVDCAEKTTLKPEDKQICDMIANPNTINVEPKDDSLLPLKVDLNDELNRHLENMMQPIRSLKSFNEEEQR